VKVTIPTILQIWRELDPAASVRHARYPASSAITRLRRNQNPRGFPMLGVHGARRTSIPTGPSLNFCSTSGFCISFGSVQ
jgi:hypothetical protein